MWIQSQNLEELLEVKRVKFLPMDNGDVRVLAKTDRQTIILGTYSKAQAESIIEDIKDFTAFRDGLYVMPPRWEDEKE